MTNSIIELTVGFFTIAAGAEEEEEDDEDEDDWMSEFIGTSQDVDMDSITQTKPTEKELPSIEDEPKEIEEVEEVDDDPFAVNVLTRKTRRRKAPVVEEEDDDVDDVTDEEVEEMLDEIEDEK